MSAGGEAGGGRDGGGAAMWLPAAGLAVSVLLGTLLRWALAGAGVPFGEFVHLRSAHSHLGFYAVLLPFAWSAWRRQGEPAPGPRVLVAYAVATAAATVEFGIRGYAPVSIAGSTVVLGVWLASAWPFRRRWAGRDWLAPVLPAVLASCLAIPMVVRLSAQGSPATLDWVHGFLSWLLLGIAIPSALRGGGAPAPPGWLHLPAVLGAGLALGPWDHPVARLLLAVEGAILVGAGWRGSGGPDLRAAWMMLGAGLAARAAGVLPWSPVLAVAAIHAAILGPFLAALAWPPGWRGARPAYLALVAAFSATVALTGLHPGVMWPRAAAVTGSVLAAAWLAVLGVAARGNRPRV